MPITYPRVNELKIKLRAGEPAYGVSIMFPSPQLVELVARLGFDWVLLDCEHGSHTPESVELMVMAAEAAGITPIARPVRNSPEEILRLIDRGVQGVQVPHVITADDARRAVSAVKYHPLGERGLAAGSRPAGYGIGLSMADYAAAANEQMLVAVQIEDAAALEQLPQLLAVEGIDVFFVGPSDLSQSLGYPGQTDLPAVRTVIDRTLAQIIAAGRTAGSAGNAAACARLASQGVDYLYTHLPTLLAAGAALFRQTIATER